MVEHTTDYWDAVVDRILDQCGITRYLLIGENSEYGAEKLTRLGICVDSLSDLHNLAAKEKYGCVIYFCKSDALNDLQVTLTSLRNHCEDALFLIVQQEFSDAGSLRSTIENTAFRCRFRKHRNYYALLDYATLGAERETLLTLLEVASLDDTTAVANRTNDRLRESGIESDRDCAHYQLAANRIKPGDTVLDIAADGGYGLHLLRANSPGRMFLGLLSNLAALDYCDRQYKSPGNIEFTIATSPDIFAGQSDNSIDFLIATDLRRTSLTAAQLYNSALRVLKPGARMLFVSAKSAPPTPIMAGFIYENRWGQIAHHNSATAAEERALYPIDSLDDSIAADYLITLVMKSPLDDIGLPYVETLHTNPKSAGNLLAYSQSYKNPWLLHALVEIPYRLQNTLALTELANAVLERSPPGTADSGAAIAILGYRTLQAPADPSAIAESISRIDLYLASVVDTAHAQRWCISLTYLAGQLLATTGKVAEAAEYFSHCLRLDAVAITPTLATKTVDAAIWLGRIQWQLGDPAKARDTWKRGLSEAQRAIQSDWREFFGDIDTPLMFAMNDAVEIVDRAAQCSHLLSATAGGHANPNAAIWNASKFSLRSALSYAEKLAHQRFHTIAELENQLHVKDCAIADLQALVHSRFNEAEEIAKRLNTTQSALTEVQQLAHLRFEEMEKLSNRLSVTDDALRNAQLLALERFTEIETLADHILSTEQALTAAQSIATDRWDEIKLLSHKLKTTDIALEKAQKLAINRHVEIARLSEKLDVTDAALASSQKLALSRHADATQLSNSLNATEIALSEAQTLALSRHAEIVQLSKKLDETDGALASAQELALSRYADATQLSNRLNTTEIALREMQALALARYDEIAQCNQQLAEKDVALNDALNLALSRLHEICILNEGLAQTQDSLIETHSRASLQLEENIALKDELAKVSLALEESELLAQQNDIEKATIMQQASQQSAALQTALQQAEQWQSHHSEILNSRTWRWTRPLRTVGDALKSFTKKLKI